MPGASPWWREIWRSLRGAEPTVRDASKSSPPSRTLHALTGHNVRYAFAAFDHPGLKIHRVAMPQGVEPDLLWLPIATANAIAHSRALVAGLPDALRRRAADGSLGIVFDSSNEATAHGPEIEAIRNELLAALGASPRNAVYLTANRDYGRQYRADCAARGVADPIPVVVHDFWIWSFMNQFETTGADIFEERLAAYRARLDQRPKRFVSLNYTPRPIKAMFLLSLMRDGLWDRGFISTGGFDERVKTVGKDRKEFVRRMAALPGFADLAAELTPLLPALADRGRVLFGPEENTGTAPMADVTLPEYGQSWFSVVTEPAMPDGPCSIDEKPFKPLVNFHPLVMLGSPGSLDLLKGFGFETFQGLLDESYDAVEPARRRFDAAYSQISRLGRMDEAELARLQRKVAERVIHNARWGLTQFPKAQRDAAHWGLIGDIRAALAAHAERPSPPNANRL